MLAMSRKAFRFLLLLSWLIAIASAVLYFVEVRALPPALSSYYDGKMDEPLTAFDFFLTGLLLLIIALNVVATVGLYRFRSWGRSLYLFAFVVSFLPLPPFEPHIETPFSTSVGALGAALCGFVLALLYFSPLSRYFEAPAAQQTFKGSDTSWQT